MFKKPKYKLWLDIILGAAYILTFASGDELAEYAAIGGVSPHELMAFLLGLIASVHIVAHWDWIIKVGKRFFQRLPRQTRINYLLNTGLFLAFSLTGLSGLLMSKTLGLSTSESFISEIHEAASTLSMLMVGGHVLLHWKWIMNAVKRYLLPGKSNPLSKSKKSPQHVMPAQTTDH